MAAGPTDSEVAARCFILGASNVTRSISTVVETARQVSGEPMELLIAAGHGRSYGMQSWVLGRGLPAILRSELWTQLERSDIPLRRALVTDIGNDLIYGASPATIAGWMEQCFDRLNGHGCQIVVTRLPMHSIASLTQLRFMLARTLLFPSSKLRYEDALNGSRELDERVHELAKQRGATIVEPQSEWYGIDPIHIRPRWARRAWKKIFSAFDTSDEADSTSTKLTEHWRLKFTCPHERTLFGVRQSKPQPAVQLHTGTRVSFF